MDIGTHFNIGEKDPALTREDVERLLQEAGSPDKLDLSFRNLANIDLAGFNLEGANLSETNLRDANLICKVINSRRVLCQPIHLINRLDKTSEQKFEQRG